MAITTLQQQIVDFKGRLVVNAPPGSGKTYTLVSKIDKVKRESNKKIIALTFSNKAAEELTNRISNQENVEIGTIHAFCQDIVMTRGYQIGLPEGLNIINSDSDKIFIIEQVLNELPFLKKPVSNNKLENILKFIKEQKQKFIGPEEILKSNDQYGKIKYEIYQGYNNKMLSQRLLDFDDLLYYAYMILSLKDNREIYQQMYGHLYVDEAQDLNYSQYQIIKLLASIIPDVMLIGDPEQSIYRFMGSNKKYMMEDFVRDFGAEMMFLSENFRSAKKIVNLINVLSDTNESLANYPIEGEVTYTQYQNEDEEALAIVEKIEELLANGLQHNEIAILGRNTYLFNSIIEKFHEKNIPFNMGLQTGIQMESQVGEILLAFIKLSSNPFNERLRNFFKDNLCLKNNHIETIEKGMQEKFLTIYNIVNSANSHVFTFGKEIESYINEVILHKEMDDMCKYLVVGDLKIIKENWDNFLKRSKTTNPSLNTFINELNMGKTKNFDLDGISLLTIHKSKGLGFDTTFVIGLNEGTLPDYRAIESSELIEEKNNVYVALSRAKRRCYISSVRVKMMPWGKYKEQKESRYVEKIKEAIS